MSGIRFENSQDGQINAAAVLSPYLDPSVGNMPYTSKCPVLSPETEGDTSMVYTISEEEYRKVVALLKTTKPLEEMMFWWIY